MRAAAALASEIERREDESVTQHFPSHIARRALHGRMRCDEKLKICVYVTPNGVRSSASFATPGSVCPSRRLRYMCEHDNACNDPLKIIGACLRKHGTPLYIPINIVPFPLHEPSLADPWAHPALEEDAHANALVIRDGVAQVFDSNKNFRHRQALRRLYSETFDAFFRDRGIRYRGMSSDWVGFDHHNLCRFAIPYMLLRPRRLRSKTDFMSWALALFRDGN